MGALGKFLLAAARLAKQGVKEGDILNQAKKEFGEVSEFMRAKIRKFYKDKDAPSIKNPSKSEGEVIEASFKPGADKRGKIVEESPSQASGIMKTDEASPLMKNIDDVKQNIKGMSENNPKTFRMSEEQRNALGYPNRMIEGIIRTSAREILSKKGIDVSKADPIDTFADIFGVNSLERLEDISDELLSAQDYKQLNSILQKNELFNVTPKSGLNLKQSDEIEELTEFDPTDREPNAMGGRIGFADGPDDPKKLLKKIPKIGKVAAGVESLINLVNKKFGKGTAKTANELESKSKQFDDFSIRNPDPERPLTDAEIRDYEAELGDSEAWLNNGTVGEAEAALKNQKSYEDSMLKEYKAEGGSKRAGGPKDPMAEAIDNASPGYSGDLKYDANVLADDLAEKRFGKEFYDLDQNQQMDLYDEAYQALAENRRVMKKTLKDNTSINDEIKRGVADVMSDTSPEGLAKSIEIDNLMLEYPGINKDFADQIASSSPTMKADMIAMVEQAFKMDQIGMSGDEIIDAFKKGTDRTKQANGGLSYLMGM